MELRDEQDARNRSVERDVLFSVGTPMVESEQDWAWRDKVEGSDGPMVLSEFMGLWMTAQDPTLRAEQVARGWNGWNESAGH